MSFYNLYFFNDKVAWMGKFILSSFLLFIFVCKAEAGIVWETTNAPIVDGKISSANAAGQGGTGKIVSMDFNDPTPNPCYKRSCIVAVGVFTNFSSIPMPYMQTYLGFRWSGDPAVTESKTMGEAYYALSRKSINNIYVGYETRGMGMINYYCDPEVASAICIIQNKWEAYSKVCYALVYYKTSTSYYDALPGQNCIGPTPPNNECNIDAGAVTLDHGQLSTDEVNGHKKQETFRISCTYPANADISLVSNNASEKIMLKGDDSLYSTVTIDGVPGITGKKINIPTGGASINLESTLHTVGNVEEGPFSGNGILIINSY
jgi:hypothetical protein